MTENRRCWQGSLAWALASQTSCTPLPSWEAWDKRDQLPPVGSMLFLCSASIEYMWDIGCLFNHDNVSWEGERRRKSKSLGADVRRT